MPKYTYGIPSREEVDLDCDVDTPQAAQSAARERLTQEGLSFSTEIQIYEKVPTNPEDFHFTQLLAEMVEQAAEMRPEEFTYWQDGRVCQEIEKEEDIHKILQPVANAFGEAMRKIYGKYFYHLEEIDPNAKN